MQEPRPVGAEARTKTDLLVGPAISWSKDGYWGGDRIRPCHRAHQQWQLAPTIAQPRPSQSARSTTLEREPSPGGASYDTPSSARPQKRMAGEERHSAARG